MKQIAVLTLITLTLACGAGPEPVAEAPPPEEKQRTGPGTATAPDGLPIAYTVHGEGEPTLVLIHGWLCNQDFWAEQVPFFSERGAVVTLDLGGHGVSGTDRSGWPLMDFGADVKAVVEELELHQVILIGHSLGGPVALEAARLMPERTIAVIAVDSLHNADAELEPDQRAAYLQAMNEDFPGYCDDMVTGMFQEGAEENLVEWVTNEMCSKPSEMAITIFAQYAEYDMASALAAVDMPVRSLNADKWPTEVEINQKYNEEYDAVIIPETGHFLMMDASDEFNEALAHVIGGMIQPF